MITGKCPVRPDAQLANYPDRQLDLEQRQYKYLLMTPSCSYMLREEPLKFEKCSLTTENDDTSQSKDSQYDLDYFRIILPHDLYKHLDCQTYGYVTIRTFEKALDCTAYSQDYSDWGSHINDEVSSIEIVAWNGLSQFQEEDCCHECKYENMKTKSPGQLTLGQIYVENSKYKGTNELLIPAYAIFILKRNQEELRSYLAGNVVVTKARMVAVIEDTDLHFFIEDYEHRRIDCKKCNNIKRRKCSIHLSVTLNFARSTVINILTFLQDPKLADSDSYFSALRNILQKLAFVLSNNKTGKKVNGQLLYRTIMIEGASGSGKSFIINFIYTLIVDYWTIFRSMNFNQTADLGEEIPRVCLVNYESLDPSTSLEGILTTLSSALSDGFYDLILCDDMDWLVDAYTSYKDKPDFMNNLARALEKLQTSDTKTVFIGASTQRNTQLLKKCCRRAAFSLTYTLGLPTQEERILILLTLIDKLPNNLTLEDINLISNKCQAFSPQDLVTLTRNMASKLLSAESQILDVHDFVKAASLLKPEAFQDVSVQIPDTKWEDIGGYENVKNLIKESVEWPILYSSLFKKISINLPKGILLYGPPGCSKTLLAKAIATQASMNFISVKGPEIFSKWVGESEENIRNIYKKARANSPCVIFLDEVDAIARKRDFLHSSAGVDFRVLCQLLSEIDGIEESKQVITICATNKPSDLDAAFLRPGRLDRLIYVPLPDYTSRLKILEVHLQPVLKGQVKVLDTSETSPITDESLVDINMLKYISQATAAYSGAEIAAICREAMISAFRDRLASTDVDLESEIQCKWKHLMSSLEKSKPRTTVQSIAYYEQFAKSNGQA